MGEGRDVPGEAFVHLRNRSPYSLLEGAIPIGKMVELAKADGMPAIGLTDTNNLFGALEFSELLSGAGVQPITGCTLSIRLTDPRPGDAAQPDGTLALLAANEAGYRNLLKLTSAAFLEVGPTELPHITAQRLFEHADGLIALTGGPDSVLNRFITEGHKGAAGEWLSRLAEGFGDRLYVELQRHGRREELIAENWLVEAAYERGLPLVATNECYFPGRDMHSAHDALLCIADSQYLTVDERRRVTPDHFFASSEEMIARFEDLPEAIENTIEIARRCSFRPKTHDPILPGFPTEGGRDELSELRAQAEEGLKARLNAVEPAEPEENYWQRLEVELEIIGKMGFPGYFLIVADFIKWAKNHDIPVGPGRGSGAGSLVAWALTITDLDPLRFGLLFERFLNPERISMPDFDVDFCQERRGEVIRYVQERYGADHVAQIITFGTLQARAVVRDVGRVLQLPLGLVDKIAKLVPANPANPVTLAEAIEIEPRLRQFGEEEPGVERLLEIALKLEGLYRNASTHAAGVVIGDRPLEELVPLYRDPRSDIPATQFNMKWVEPAGLVKFDFLGLKTLTVIARAIGYIEKAGGEVPDLENAAFDDPKVYELLSTGAGIGVFQMESSGMRDTLSKMKPDKIEDLIALISLYRPGPMKNIDVYVDRKFGRAEVDYLHPDLKQVLNETYGVIIYQEQVMQIAQILSGYSLGEADLLRRAMGKKKKEEMAQQKVRFLEGAEAKGVSRGKAEYIFELVNEFAGYGFNKSHAAAYAAIAYRTGYLKANHPVEFLAALMSLDRSNVDKLAVFFQEARRMDVPVQPPDINISEADFSVKDGAVIYALGAIRNVSLSAMEALVAEREANGPFKDVFDFAERVDPRLLNKRTLENLARAGAFDSLEPDRAKAFAAAETLCAMAAKAQEERETAQVSLFGDAAPDAGGLARPKLPEPPSWTATQRLDEELAAIGFYLSGHPLDDMADMLARRGVVFVADAPDRVADGASAIRMAGVVRRRQERVSQKSGKRFAWVTLSDPSGEFEVLVNPDMLNAFRDVLEVGASVMVGVSIDDKEEQLRFFSESIEALDEAPAADALRVRLEPEALESVKARLDRAAESGKGEGVVYLVLAVSEGGEAELRLPGRVPTTPPVQAALRGVKGVESVELI
ncbi:DNA polymerase III subunit alpha [Hyphobacterium sp. HN65]|uniref:DNA polymerase III subunit alpha n=1 Tax=Hyphobacterium lacteum TaxID=3116575 RepID=A0ABU7LLT8_9PROT|nr:DNA polymerase III subunit alpha [Hyphobacterium sp. HN65]MEE2524890.1 DNA polymerase III subunit alpha [Hyphobacterium sp. HN65]